MTTAVPGEDIGFYALPHAGLRRHGIDGKRLSVFCLGDTLRICGDNDAMLDIPAAGVRRLRLGMTATRFNVYHFARIFLAGESEPLLLMPEQPRCPHYAAVMRRFALALADAGGLGRLEHGDTVFATVATFIAVLATTLGASLVALFVWSDEFGMTGAIVFTIIMAAATGLFAWQSIVHDLPRAMASPGEIDRYLPKPR